MANNKINNSQEQENKKKKKGFAAWWHNLGKGGQVALCALAGVAVTTAVVVPTVIAINNNKAVALTIIGADIDKTNSSISLNKDSTVAFTYADNKDFVKVNYVKVGGKEISSDSYTLVDGNSQSKKIVIKAKAMTSVKVEISVELKDKEEPKPETEGNLFHVYCWNTEFLQFFNKYVSDEGKELLAKGEIMSDERVTSPIGLHLNGKDVKFTIVPSNDGAYREALNEALKNNKTAKEEDKVDLFLVEADYMVDYVDSEYSHDISKVGITDEDLKYTYEYANEMATDINGVHKGVSFQVSPSAFLYRRSVAKDVFGTDDPDSVQKEVADWDKFIDVAAMLGTKGTHKVSASVYDLYKAKTANLSTPWVTNKTLSIPDEVEAWLDMSKKFIDSGYSTTAGTWESEHSSYLEQSLCMIAPSWYYNYCMDSLSYTSGDWAICEGPEPSYWGGTWMLAAEGGDNDSLVAKTMKDFLSNEDEVLSNMVNVDKVMVNNSAYNDKNADTLPGNKFLGDQNDYKVLSSIAKNIKINRSAVTTYDQVCNEQYQSAMKTYFNGEATKDEALEIFKKEVKEIYPELNVSSK